MNRDVTIRLLPQPIRDRRRSKERMVTELMILVKTAYYLDTVSSLVGSATRESVE